MENLGNLFVMSDVFDMMNLGLIVIRKDGEVVYWNRWLAERTKTEEKEVLGKKLEAVFHEPLAPALLAGIDRTFDYGSPGIFSNALHGAPLPLYRGPAIGMRSRIDQSIVLSPIVSTGGERYCMIQVHDASGSVKRENMLRANKKKLRFDASVDELTGLPNRDSFEDHASVMLRLAKKTKSEVSVFLIDIDNFGLYNERYGPSRGDEAIKKIASALHSRVFRATDMVARFGGGVFIVVMMGLDLERADHIAGRLRASVAECGIMLGDSRASGNVTVSIGVCTSAAGESVLINEIMEGARDALCKAKAEGKNMISSRAYRKSN